MKLKLLLLFAVFQAGFSFTQFDPNYYGSYKSEDEKTYFYIYDMAESDRLDLTDAQRKNAVFLFSYQNLEAEGMSVAMKKGTGYVSLVNEYATEEFTFAFKNLDGVQTLDITGKSGQKFALTKMVVDPYYYDDETYSDYEGYSDEESGDVGYYYDEETSDDAPYVFQFTRADKGELLLFMKNDSTSISLTIPATKSCPALELAGDLVQQEGSQTTYFYTDPSGYKLKAEMISKDENPGWKFTCVSGNCPDANNKCGIWKEEFMLGY
jgi:hypothetical protein